MQANAQSSTIDAIPYVGPMRFQLPGQNGAPHLRSGRFALRLPIDRPRHLRRLDAAYFKDSLTQDELVGETPIYSTLGWDTVFAVPVDRVNTIFSKSGQYPTDFEYTLTGSLVVITIKGKFGAWAITPGGSGGLMNMRVPIANGMITPSGGTAQSIAGAVATIQITLKYLEQKKTQPDNATPYDLKFNQDGPGSGVQPVVVLKLENPNSTDPVLNALLQTAIQGYLNANTQQIAYVFNTVNLNMTAAKDAFQWLKPTTTDYAYYQDTKGSNQIFGVLNMVLDNPSTDLSNQIAPAAIPEGQQSGFSISDPTFLMQMALPTLGNAWPKTVDSSYFTITEKNTKVINTKGVPMNDIDYGGITYHPICEQFWMMVQATTLVIYMKIHIPITPGIDAYAETTSYMGLQLGTNDKGEQTLSYYEVRPSDQNHWVEKATWVIITEVIAGIIAACIAVGVGAMFKGVLRVVVGIIIGLVLGAIAAIPEYIALIAGSGTTAKLPSISGLVTDATNAIVWPGGQAFKITKVQLNGAMQMGGDAYPNIST